MAFSLKAKMGQMADSFKAKIEEMEKKAEKITQKKEEKKDTQKQEEKQKVDTTPENGLKFNISDTDLLDQWEDISETDLNGCKSEADLNGCKKEADLNGCKSEADLNGCKNEADNGCKSEADLKQHKHETDIKEYIHEPDLNGSNGAADLKGCKRQPDLNGMKIEADLKGHRSEVDLIQMKSEADKKGNKSEKTKVVKKRCLCNLHIVQVLPQGDDNGGHQVGILNTGRRSKLPCPKPDVDISLWSLLCKNIGKDLSKISMPVTLNEPISMLQRLCEELEYTELVDKAADIDDPFERMVYMAAFTVSPYASTYYRAGQKPFNPMLGETYECLREDKGWRFIAEQTSHHPPVSACYCESKNFIFWQDIQIKTKFWGKSMEIQPKGTVNLKLPKYKDHYTWNKATTCVHNLLGGQRWVDHYGEVVIRNHSQGIKCKLTYAKSSYWSDKRHEVYGTITNSDGKVVHHLFGKWNEGIYYGHAPSAKCVWRPGSMPEEFDLYYGFTRFAMELNEVQADQAHLYAPTDTRYRPDQRLLEEGKIAEAEAMKVHVEQVQRDQRRKREEEKTTYTPKWFMRVEEGGQESYMYTGKYWEMRKDPAFSNLTFPKLW